jgi:two-component system chemotaxis response regulator CheY
MSYRVLVVDDAGPIRRMVVRAVEMSGLPIGEVFEAGDGGEALEVLAANWVDIVFTDIHMPGVDGIELVKRMAGDPLLRGIPVVVVSTERSEARIATLRRLGIRAYLPKPFRPEAVREVVLELLGAGEARP